jgi:hypothetical protein
MAYIERAITSVLKNRVSSSKCLLLTGARHVGKSTLIKHVFPEYNIANFDDRLTRLQAKVEPKLFFIIVSKEYPASASGWDEFALNGCSHSKIHMQYSFPVDFRDRLW